MDTAASDPHEPYAAVAETHISTVLFAGDRAYKLLKPLRTAFLDHSTTELRAEACRLEYELNRRLAPDVYLGVSALSEEGVVSNHILVMRRLPASRRLTALLRTPERDDAVRQVARAVASFHAGLPADSRGAAIASRDAVRRLWRHNLDEMAEFRDVHVDGAVLDEVDKIAMTYLAGRDRLFADRLHQGLTRDGHGDLLADDIFCMPDGPRILDCLAFDDALRISDVLLDAAFLAMDLERLAGMPTAHAFLRWYQEFSNEHHPQSLADHYVAYRALVRCKVSCLRAAQGAAGAADDARSFLDMTLRHLRSARPRLVLVGGAPGTGKTTTANGLAAACGYAVLSSDEVRKDLAGFGHFEHAFAEPEQGIYRREMTDRVYDALIERAAELLELGESIIVDASWTDASYRERARHAATERDAELIELRCKLDPIVAAARIERRLASEQTTSDATPTIAKHLADIAALWPEAIEIDTTERPEHVTARAAAIVERGYS